jgi:hypothetical protein
MLDWIFGQIGYGIGYVGLFLGCTAVASRKVPRVAELAKLFFAIVAGR